MHLQGTPHEIGFQNGYLLAPEIEDILKVVILEETHSSRKDWQFFRDAAQNMMWPHICLLYTSPFSLYFFTKILLTVRAKFHTPETITTSLPTRSTSIHRKSACNPFADICASLRRGAAVPEALLLLSLIHIFL